MSKLVNKSADKKNKSKSKKHKDQSIPNVYRGPLGRFGGPREPISIRIDKSLYKRFKLATKVFGSSVCSEVETFMIAYIGVLDNANYRNVHIGNTFYLDQVVYRNLDRDRRKVNPDFVKVSPIEVGYIEDSVRLVLKRVRENEGSVSLIVDCMREAGVPPLMMEYFREEVIQRVRVEGVEIFWKG